MRYKTAKELYDRLDVLMERLNERFDCEGTLQDAKAYLEDGFDRGYTSSDLYTDGFGDGVVLIHPHLFRQAGWASYASVLIMAYACCLEGQRAEAKGELIEAAELFAKANRFCQEADANDQVGYKDSVIVERASKGGMARAQRYDPAIEYLIQLLKDKCPEGGWGSASKTAQVLAPDFIEFLETYSMEDASAQISEEPEGLIIRWLTKDGPAREEFMRRKGRT